jgi:hypothetical protein
MKVLWAKSHGDAARELEITYHGLRRYSKISAEGTPFKGIRAYFNAGTLADKERGQVNVVMPLERLKAIIDRYKELEVKYFKELGEK